MSWGSLSTSFLDLLLRWCGCLTLCRVDDLLQRMSEELEGKSKQEAVPDVSPRESNFSRTTRPSLTESLGEGNYRQHHAAKRWTEEKEWGRKMRREGGWRQGGGAEWGWRRGGGDRRDERGLGKEDWYGSRRERRSSTNRDLIGEKTVRLDATTITTEQWNTQLPRSSREERYLNSER